MKTQIKSYLPIFSGFYGTIFEPSNEEAEIEEINRIREEKGLSEINYDDCIFNYSEYRTNVAKQCTNFVENTLNDIFSNKVKIEFEDIRSPKYYDFENDSINVTFEIYSDFISELKEYIIKNISAFEVYLERYKSCSGFSSFYSHLSDTWINEYINQIDENTHILGSLLDFVLNNEDDEAEMNMYYSINDNYVFAENFSELTEE